MNFVHPNFFVTNFEKNTNLFCMVSLLYENNDSCSLCNQK